MTDPIEAPPAGPSRRWLVITLAVAILLVAVIAARQLASRPPAPDQAPAADCEEAPQPESFTLADCDADPGAQPKPAPQRR